MSAGHGSTPGAVQDAVVDDENNRIVLRPMPGRTIAATTGATLIRRSFAISSGSARRSPIRLIARPRGRSSP